MTGAWRDQAPCAHPSVSPQDFSPVDSRGRLDQARAQRLATKFCGRCPVRETCLDEAKLRRPQELVQAGMWWPADTKAGPRPPLDLLVADDEPAPVRRSEGAAA